MRLAEQWTRDRKGPGSEVGRRAARPHDRRRVAPATGCCIARAGEPGSRRELALVPCRARRQPVSDPKRCGDFCAGSTTRESAERSTLVSTGESPVEPVASRVSLAAAWDDALASLPADWSDLLCEIELTSSDHIDHAALLMAPLNPIQGTGQPSLPLPVRPHVRIRRGARDGAALPRAGGRAADPGQRARRARALRHAAGRARRARSGTSAARPSDVADPVSWIVIEHGWAVLDSDGDAIGRCTRSRATRTPTSSTACRSSGDPEQEQVCAVGARRRDSRGRSRPRHPATTQVENARDVHRAGARGAGAP